MKKNIIFVCLSILFLTSCSDWLDVKPKTTVEEEEIFSRELGFKEALTGVYIKMASTGLYGRTLSYGFLDILGQRYQPSNPEAYQDELWYTFPSTKTEGYTNSIWKQMYNVIANVNNLLYYCDKNKDVFTTEHYYEIIKGEALALRAFLHFDVLRMYGPVYKDNMKAKRMAYRTVFSREALQMMASDAVVDSVIMDLKQAELLLKDTDPLNFDFPQNVEEEAAMKGDRFLVYRHKRMNLYAVKAMLARVYLYAGNQTEAVRYANEVINSGVFDFVANTADVQRSKEIIFSVYIDKFEAQVKEDLTSNGSYYISGRDFLDGIFDVMNDGTNDFRIREGVSFEYGNNGITMRKYKQDIMWASTEGTIVLIRLAEMYYILAECAADTKTAALYLNKVREARGVDPVSFTEATRLYEIEKEYRKEFYGEGQLFFFYKRHGYSSFLHCPVKEMAESNYMFSWPEDEVLFGKTN